MSASKLLLLPTTAYAAPTPEAAIVTALAGVVGFLPADLIRIAEKTEARLERDHLTKAERVGIEIAALSAGNGRREQAAVLLRRTAKGWTLHAAEQSSSLVRQPERVEVCISQQHAADLGSRCGLDWTCQPLKDRGLPLIVSAADAGATKPFVFPTTEAREAAQDAIGKATSWRHGALTVAGLCQKAERWLSAMGVPAAKRVGFQVHHTPSGPSANAYRYAVKSNSVVLRRTAKGWVLEASHDCGLYPRAPETLNYCAPEALAKLIRELAASDYHHGLPSKGAGPDLFGRRAPKVATVSPARIAKADRAAFEGLAL